MKKVLFFVLIVAVVAAFAINIAAVETDAPSFVVDTVTCKPGDTVKINVSVKNNPGIVSARLVVTYDSPLSLEAVEYGSELGGSAQIPAAMTSPFVLNWISPFAELKKDVTFATLTFSVPSGTKNGKYYVEIGYNPEDVFNAGEANVAFGKTDGVINVNGGTETTTSQTTSAETTSNAVSTTIISTTETTSSASTATTAETTSAATSSATETTSTETTSSQVATQTTASEKSTSGTTAWLPPIGTTPSGESETSASPVETTSERSTASETSSDAESTPGISSEIPETTDGHSATSYVESTEKAANDDAAALKKIIIPIAITAIAVAILAVVLLTVKKK